MLASGRYADRWTSTMIEASTSTAPRRYTDLERTACIVIQASWRGRQTRRRVGDQMAHRLQQERLLQWMGHVALATVAPTHEDGEGEEERASPSHVSHTRFDDTVVLEWRIAGHLFDVYMDGVHCCRQSDSAAVITDVDPSMDYGVTIVGDARVDFLLPSVHDEGGPVSSVIERYNARLAVDEYDNAYFEAYD